jgi:hypothetical protein
VTVNEYVLEIKIRCNTCGADIAEDAQYYLCEEGGYQHLHERDCVEALRQQISEMQELLLEGAKLRQAHDLRGNHRSCGCSTCTAWYEWSLKAEKAGMGK